MLLQTAYLHLTWTTWKAHSLKSLSEYGPEQQENRRKRRAGNIYRWDGTERKWNPKGEKKEVGGDAGQACSLVHFFETCPSPSQQQTVQVPPGDSVQQGVTHPEAVRATLLGHSTRLVTASSMWDSMSQSQCWQDVEILLGPAAPLGRFSISVPPSYHWAEIKIQAKTDK